MTANEITAALLIEIPKRFPRARLWRQNVGVGVGMSVIKKAVAMILAGNIKAGVALLSSRPIHYGFKGQADICGIFPVMVYHPVIDREFGLFMGIEIKADGDKMSDEQSGFRQMVLDRGGVFVEARSVGETLEYLESIVKESFHP